MDVRRYVAPYLYLMDDEQGFEPIRWGGLALDECGVVREIFRMENHPEGPEAEGIEVLDGILCPGFVNAHTHMELSYFDGVFLPGGSMAAFLRQIDELRVDADAEFVQRSLEAGYAVMAAEGQVGYADISNQADTVGYKRNEKFASVSFVELFGVNGELGRKAYDVGLTVLDEYHRGGVESVYLTPHAPYSVSRELWDLLIPHLEQAPIFSLHFCETFQEVEFLESGGGAIANLYGVEWGRTLNMPTGAELLEILCRLGRDGKRILLIHNAAIPEEYLSRIQAECPGASFVLCPASNLFIGGKMPDVPLLRRAGVNIAIGTDSLSSSPSLSILDQLRLIDQYYGESEGIDLGEYLYWATRGGAQACGFDDLGRIAVGLAPGVNLLSWGSLRDEGSLRGVQSRPLSNRVARFDVASQGV